MPALPFNKKPVMIAIVVIVVLVVGVVVVQVLGIGRQPPPLQKVNLNLWSPLDRKDAVEPLWKDFASSKNIEVRYRQFNSSEYEQQLLDALAAGTGPDIFLIKNTWLGRYFNKIMPMNDPTVYAVKDVDNDFVELVKKDVTLGDKIWGLPLFMDSLALIYNRNYFNAEGFVAPPKTWEEFQTMSRRLTKYDASGKIIRSGASLGSGENVDNAKDIVSLLMLQSGLSDLSDPKTSEAIFNKSFYNTKTGGFIRPSELGFSFYLGFASSSVPTWDRTFKNSIVSFAEAKSAMVLAYASQLDQIRKSAPQLRWAIAPMPQFANADVSKNYGEFWMMVVSLKSKAQNDAWQIVLQSARAPQLKDYLKTTQRPPALRRLIPEFQSDSTLGVFAVQNLTAQSWYHGDEKAIERAFVDMIESILDRKVGLLTALRGLLDNVTIILRKNPGSQAWELPRIEKPKSSFKLFGQ